MKYIRTRYKIREIIEDFGGSCNVKSTYQKGRPSIDNFTVVSGVRFAPRAETIEELCDEIVYKNYFFNQDEPMLYPKEWDYKTLLKQEPNVIVYGAIWTDKGLIYVAKMNDKGELELL